MPPKARVLTDEERVQVEALASVLTSEQIADYLGIGRTTFYEIMDRDADVSERYKKGRARAINDVANGLIAQAKEGNVAASIFYLKTKAGWRETDDKQDKPQMPTINIVMPDGNKTDNSAG